MFNRVALTIHLKLIGPCSNGIDTQVGNRRNGKFLAIIARQGHRICAGGRVERRVSVDFTSQTRGRRIHGTGEAVGDNIFISGCAIDINWCAKRNGPSITAVDKAVLPEDLDLLLPGIGKSATDRCITFRRGRLNV